MKKSNIILFLLLAVFLASCSSSKGGYRRKDKCPGMRMHNPTETKISV